MKFIVFEAGSRAGFSAEMFFRAWLQAHPESNVRLVLADSDFTFTEIPSDSPISRKSAQIAEAMVGKRKVRVFPGDELTRQRSAIIQEQIKSDSFAAVEDWYYDKAAVNQVLYGITHGKCFIKIPRTMNLTDVCIKPNTESAGSRGIELLSNVCVSERIQIASEYVVDVLEKNGEYSIFAREVKLRNGYDKYVRLLPESDKLVAAVRQFLQVVRENTKDSGFSLFSGIFHLQVAKDVNGEYFFIEASKRISGSSIVNLSKGFNPFDLLMGTDPVQYESFLPDDIWVRFEDIISHLSNVI